MNGIILYVIIQALGRTDMKILRWSAMSITYPWVITPSTHIVILTYKAEMTLPLLLLRLLGHPLKNYILYKKIYLYLYTKKWKAKLTA